MAKRKFKHIKSNVYELNGKKYYKLGIYYFTYAEIRKGLSRGAKHG